MLNLSLNPIVDSLLPKVNSPERNNLADMVSLRFNATMQSRVGVRHKLGKLFLVVVKEAAEGVVNGTYRHYDALIKNFGCQITALEVQDIVRDGELLEESRRVQEAAQKAIRDYPPNPPKIVLRDQSLEGYLTDGMKINIAVSDKLRKLIRYRLLTILNDNKLKEDGDKKIEAPFTNIMQLCKKISSTAHSIRELYSSVGAIASGIQAEESVFAARYIQGVAAKLPEGIQTSVIRSALRDVRMSQVANLQEQSPIASVPLLHNIAAVLKGYQGVMCVKNKLQLCGQPIPDAVPQKVFLKMPSGELLNEEEVMKMDDREPILVIEGYVKNGTDLAAGVSQGKIMDVVLANCAALPQYASGVSQDPSEDAEVKRDIARYVQMKKLINVIEIDHFYCASIKEER